MMGLLVMMCCGGLLLGAGAAIVKPMRRIAFPVAIACVVGSIAAFALSWGLALGLEWLFSSTIGGVGFLFGYALGLVLGLLTGLRLGRRLRTESALVSP